MKRICLAMGALLALNTAQAVELYRWVDKDGVMHYSEHPNPEAEKVQLGIPAASGVEDATLPFETRQAHQRFPVTMYVDDACADSCKQAREFLKKRRVPFSEVVMKTEEDLAAFKQKSGTDTVPTISIGRTWLKGFQSQDWNNELDAAGYPK